MRWAAGLHQVEAFAQRKPPSRLAELQLARNEIAHLNYASSIVSRWGHQSHRPSIAVGEAVL